MRKTIATVILATSVVGTSISMLVPADAAGVSSARILIVGDSVTQGKVGDHTWRYRLWNTLQAQGKAVEFVGPHAGLFDPATSSTDAPGYADPNFDQDHAAWWGMSLTDIDVRMNVRDAMTTYAPDVVVNALGINDLAFVATPAQLIDRMTQFVADVRAVNPHASIVLGQLTQTWFTNGGGAPVVEQYNAMLLDMVASLDQPDARVVAAIRPGDFVQNVDTYDPAHPSPSGEVKLAAQYAGALELVGLPDAPTPPVPPSPTTYSGSARLAALAIRPRTARLSFTTPAGATRQAIWKRDLTTGSRWRLVAHVGPTAHKYRVTSLRHDHRYAFRMRAYKGEVVSTTWSNRARARIS